MLSSKAAAGAVAQDRDPRRVDAELPGVLGEPHEAGVAVLDGGRVRVLGREPVRHREEGHAGRRNVAGDGAVGHVAEQLGAGSTHLRIDLECHGTLLRSR